jgi:nucleotide-binding universal stress UspA family protein
MGKMKILIPTDFSVQAEYAYLMVKKLEEKAPIDIHFVHVLDLPDSVTINETGNIETCGEIDVEYVVTQRDIANRKLSNLKTLYGNHISVQLILGKLTDAIINYSEKHNFDLIVMGTKGAWGIKEIISGSEAQFIARKSKIPLLTLMCDRSDLVIKNILLVHDFNKVNNDNLILLKKFVSAFESKTHFLQIIDSPSENERKKYFDQMDEYANMNDISNYEKHLLHDTDIENGVVHFNQMHDVDLVCIGTHGRGGIFHSSAAEKLINHLFKPIITFHLNN